MKRAIRFVIRGHGKKKISDLLIGCEQTGPPHRPQLSPALPACSIPMPSAPALETGISIAHEKKIAVYPVGHQPSPPTSIFHFQLSPAHRAPALQANMEMLLDERFLGLQTDPLRIVDLPNETLIRIFEFVEGFDPQDSASWINPSKNIKSVRLTCRRFCQTSSHLLIRLVRVQLNNKSLARLERISNHPTLSQGVRAVRIALHFYYREFCKSIVRFHTYNLERMNYQVSYFGLYSSQKDPVLRELERRARQKADPVLQSWLRIDFADDRYDKEVSETLESRPTPDRWSNLGFEPHLMLSRFGRVEGDDRHRLRFITAHQDYCRGFVEQELLREDAKFSKAVGAAMARMPFARRLEFYDTDPVGEPLERKLGRYGVSDEPIYEAAARPMTGREARGARLVDGLGGSAGPLHDIMLGLPAAAGKAGARIECIDIRLWHVSPQTFDAFTADEESRKSISAATQGLKEFSFRRDTEDSFGYRMVLGPFLDTPSLRVLNLDFTKSSNGYGTATEPLGEAIGEVLTLRSWPNLRELHLRGINFTLREIEKFATGLERPLQRLTLDRVCLLGDADTWADVLDKLYNKCTGEVVIDKLFVRAGGIVVLEPGLAEQFIRGKIHVNPWG